MNKWYRFTEKKPLSEEDMKGTTNEVILNWP
jgi:hypothetical protein